MKKHMDLFWKHFFALILLVVVSACIIILQTDLPFGRIDLNKLFFLFLLYILAVSFSFFNATRISNRSETALSELDEKNKDLERRVEYQELMITFTQEMMDIKENKNSFDKILEYAIASIDHADAGSIMLMDKNNRLSFVATRGYDNDALSNVEMDIKDTFLWNKSGGNISGPVIVNDAKAFSRSITSPPVFDAFEKTDTLVFESSLCSPLFLDKKLYGMINVDSKQNNVFGDRALGLIKHFTAHAEFAIKNLGRIEHIYKLSRFDSLTKVFNRRHFQDLVEMDISKASRFDISFLLVIFDLDNLKCINDTYGHQIGDKCIIHFSDNLKKLIRKQDLLARYGGDEFIAYFYMCDWKALTLRIEEFRNHFKNNPFVIGDIEISISFSYGIAEFPSDGKSYSELFKKADSLMYSSKKEFKKLCDSKKTDLQE